MSAYFSPCGNIISDSLNNLTRFVLVNAIYYKNFWNVSFLKNETRNDDFFIKPNTPKKVPTMHLETKLLTGHLESLNSRWLQLPFQVSSILEEEQCEILDY
jgi:serpin B